MGLFVVLVFGPLCWATGGTRRLICSDYIGFVTGEPNCMGHASARMHFAIHCFPMLSMSKLNQPFTALNKGGGGHSEQGSSYSGALYKGRGVAGKATETPNRPKQTDTQNKHLATPQPRLQPHKPHSPQSANAYVSAVSFRRR